jgi:hypothetical protein
VHELFEIAQDQRMVKLKEMQSKLQKSQRSRLLTEQEAGAT